MEEIGLPGDGATAIISALPEFLRKTDGTGRVAGPPKVFISHSHYDRETASLLQIVLEQNKVLTFLDQHQIVAGQDLKVRLITGLIWCDQLLLLWSAHTGRSEFVAWEWQCALRLMKPILPYVLDETPLPNALKMIVHIDRSDREHGYAELLRAILGRQWKPDTTTLFPGLWYAEVNILEILEASYELELRANGQVIGHVSLKQPQRWGLPGVYATQIPMTGTWTHDERERVLELRTIAHLMGQVHSDVVRIRTTGKEEGWLHAQTEAGFSWRMKRVR